MFELDTGMKREALNYAVLMNVLNCTDHKLSPLFDEFCKNVPGSVLLNDKSVLDEYVHFFKIDKNCLLQEYENAKEAFSKLKITDEIIKYGQDDYPPLLAQTEQAPRFLYIRGKKSLLYEKRTVALVGSRKASKTAQKKTRDLAIALGDNGIVIVSGLAKGIDATAHRAALDGGFNTIAVLGTNLNQYYPSENKAIQSEIGQKGLVISQFSPASKTERWFFPLRNGVMSGLSLATVIMEAGETSGALKQADFALKQGRYVLIPKSALEMSKITWPAKYVQKGARVFETTPEILQILAQSHIFDAESQNEMGQLTLEEYLPSVNAAATAEKEEGKMKLTIGESN